MKPIQQIILQAYYRVTAFNSCYLYYLLNPYHSLSLLLGYNIAKKNNKQKLTHLFFVDDFARQTFARNKKETLQLDLIMQFTKDIDTKFGLDKCAYIYIVQGIQKSRGRKLSINGTDIEELDSGETYTYLGHNEDIGFKGELNKQIVKADLEF